IYFGDSTQWYPKFYASGGPKEWVFVTGSGYLSSLSSPAIGPDGTIYFGYDKLYAMNPNGTFKWAFNAGNFSLFSPVVGPYGTIYCADHDERLHALNPDGTEDWHFDAGSLTGEA